MGTKVVAKLVPGAKLNIFVPKYRKTWSQLSEGQPKSTAKITGDHIWQYNCDSIKERPEFKNS